MIERPVDTERSRMLALADRVTADELLAVHFAHLARLMDERGSRDLVAVFLSNSRHHRVQAIKRRAQLAELIELYGDADYR